MNLSKRYAHLITDRPVMVLLSMLIMTLLVASGLANLTVRTNQDADLPVSDSIVQTKERIDAVFGDRTEVMIGIQHDNIFNTTTLGKVVAISERLKQVDHVVPDQIDSLSTLNNVIGEEWGMQVGVFMRAVPEGPAALDKLAQDVRDNRLVYGRLVSFDEDFTVITARVEEGYDQATLYAQIYAIVEEYEGPERIFVTGEPIFTQEIDGGIQRDTAVLIPLALLLILVGLFLCFRSLRGVLLPMLAVLLSIVWAMGMMGHLGLPQTAVSTALPLLLVTIASSYAIHILIYFNDEQADDPDRVAKALSKIMPSLLMVGITSALGAASLYVFQILMIREFAIASAVGILSAWLINVTVIPAILQLISRSSRMKMVAVNQPSRLDRLLTRVTLLSYHNSKKVVVGYLLLLLVAGVGISKVQTGLDFLNLFKEDNQARVAFNVFNDSLGGARSFSIMVEGTGEGDIQTLEYLESIARFQSFMNQQEGVGYTHSIADVIDQIAEAVAMEDAAGARLVSDAQVAEYLMLYEMSGDPGDFANLVDYDYRRARIQVMLTTSDPDQHRALYETARDYLADHLPEGASAEFGGDIILWLARVDYVVMGKLQNIALALSLIILITSLALRSVSAGLLAVAPIAAGVLITFAFMGFYGLRLDMPTSIITGIAVGIGIDFSIHYLSRVRKEMLKSADYASALRATSTTSAKAVVFDTFTNMLGFSMLIFSQFQPVQVFGYLVSFTMLIMGLSVLVLFPALLHLTRPAFIFAAQLPPAEEVKAMPEGVGADV